MIARKVFRRDRQLARVLASGESGRGSAYQWLRKRHDAFATGMRAPDFPGWAATHQRLVALGLRDGAGKPPTLRGLQAIWYRVKADVKAARDARPEPRPVFTPAPGEIVPGFRLAPGAPRAAEPTRAVPPVVPPSSRSAGDVPVPDAPRPRLVLTLPGSGPLPPKTGE